MIDIHSHIIPGVDDGAESWEEAVEMCRLAWTDGIKVVVATPHALNGVYLSDKDFIAGQIKELKNRISQENIGLEILQGAEVYSSPDLPLILTEEPSFTFSSNGRYFLLEFPHSVIPPYSEQLIFQLCLRNLVPIIVHPERNLHVQGNTSILERLLAQGAFCQVTAMSVTGGFGRRAQECAHSLLKKRLVHAVASDAHNMKRRQPILSKARRVIEELMGHDTAQQLFEVFPKKVLSGEI